MKKQNRHIAVAVLLTLCVSACTKQNAGETNAKVPASPIPTRISLENTDAAEPAVATASDGSIYVVWIEHRKEGQADVLLRKTRSDGTQAGEPVRVNPEAGKATAWRGDPPTVVVATDGTVFVAWTSPAAAKGHENNLYLSASRDGGKSFETPVKINDDAKPAVHGMHSLAIDNEGRLHIAWLDERNVSPAAPIEKHRGEAHAMESNREVFTAFSEDGGRTISRNQLIARDACPCCKTAVATAGDGRVYVGWRQVLKGNFRHIAVAASSDKGHRFLPPVIVSDDKWVISGCPVSGPALLAGDNGSLRVLWYTEGEAAAQGLYFARSSDGGQTFTARTLVFGGAARGNPLLMPGATSDNTVAIWENGESGLMRADITSDGSVKNTLPLMSAGKLPSAAQTRERSVLAYISTLNDQRSIWILVGTNEQPSARL